MNKQQTKAFTLVELIVVITILAILGTIAFIAMEWYSKDSRDSVRLSDISTIKSWLELFHVDSGKYPLPTDAQSVTYSGWVVWYQGSFWKETFTNIWKLDDVPLDPLTEKEYSYSIIANKNEFQIWWISEGADVSFLWKANASDKVANAILRGNYNGMSTRVNTNGTTYVLAIPSITTSTDLSVEANRTLENIITAKEIVLNGYQNLPNTYYDSSYYSTKETLNPNYEVVKDNDINNIVVYEWDLANLDSITLVTNLQNAYSGTTAQKVAPTNELFSVDVNDPGQLTEVDRYWVNFINNNLGGSVVTKVFSSCDGWAHNSSKLFYTANSANYPSTCNEVAQSFTCVDGIWRNAWVELDTGTYPYDSCTTVWAVDCNANAAYAWDTSHSYNVTALTHWATQNFTTDVNENNGTFRYAVDVNCDNGTLSNTAETGPSIQGCDVDFYDSWDGNCSAVGIWFYSTAGSTTKTACTNKPSNSSYTSDGGWVDNCSWSCDSEYFNNWWTCESQWTGDGSSTPYTFKNTSWVAEYPINCSDLLAQSTWKNTYGWSPWNGNSFADGIYYIKPYNNAAFEVYCDMTTDWGGWTKLMHANYSNFFTTWNWSSINTTSPTNTTLYSILNKRDLFKNGSQYYFRINVARSGNSNEYKTSTAHKTIWKQNHDPFTSATDGSDFTFVWWEIAAWCGGFNGFHNRYLGYSMATDPDTIDSTGCWRFQLAPTLSRQSNMYLDWYGWTWHFHKRQILWIKNEDFSYLWNQPSCLAHKNTGSSIDGIYEIDPDGVWWNAAYNVYCDMTTDGGGWTLIVSQKNENRFTSWEADYYYGSGPSIYASKYSIMQNIDNITANNEYKYFENRSDSTSRWVITTQSGSILTSQPPVWSNNNLYDTATGEMDWFQILSYSHEPFPSHLDWFWLVVNSAAKCKHWSNLYNRIWCITALAKYTDTSPMVWWTWVDWDNYSKTRHVLFWTR